MRGKMSVLAALCARSGKMKVELSVTDLVKELTLVAHAHGRAPLPKILAVLASLPPPSPPGGRRGISLNSGSGTGSRQLVRAVGVQRLLFGSLIVILSIYL